MGPEEMESAKAAVLGSFPAWNGILPGQLKVTLVG